ncbi:MAG: hypothetical protein K2H70_06220 [Bacteroidales bacterium]|nr:hypothetical protein [Bacteroidales bacterium]
MESVLKFWRNIEGRVKDMLPVQVFPAVVKEVDEGLRTCTVRINDNVDFEDVRLYAVVDDDLKGFCLIPAVDSTVLVGRIANGNELCVVSFSVVDKVLGTIGDKVEIAIDEKSLSYKCDKTEMVVKSAEVMAKIDGVELEAKENKVKVKADEIAFNGGEKGELINIDDLTGKINELVDVFNEHTHTIKSISVPALGLTSPAGAVTGTANTASVDVPTPDSPASKLDKKDYKDDKIKH